MINHEIASKIIPPANDQKDDPKWEWEFNGKKISISGNAQCQGNCNENLLKIIAEEFSVNDLKHINTFNYYSMFFAWMFSTESDVDRSDLMNWKNHVKFLNYIFESNNIPVVARGYSDEKNGLKSPYIRSLIQKTGRGLSIGTLATSSGHWINIYAVSNDKYKGNDSWGQIPYKKDQKGGYFEIDITLLESKMIRRVIYLENKT